jgi:hypothetical protein
MDPTSSKHGWLDDWIKLDCVEHVWSEGAVSLVLSFENRNNVTCFVLLSFFSAGQTWWGDEDSHVLRLAAVLFNQDPSTVSSFLSVAKWGARGNVKDDGEEQEEKNDVAANVSGVVVTVVAVLVPVMEVAVLLEVDRWLPDSATAAGTFTGWEPNQTWSLPHALGDA